ncbi:permease prefix domain 1-containing protein [Salicibibacter kimchii]|uniref:DUF1129 family protein n=1 Tax=Salicibibacter kimchii TaxID=2099786 RepID=A0A345C2F4_9BACI|nr:permease prefix domain 1-containing protein [Salicibibacter kimchii]AXF57385.1 hypothetical protein DT065_16220 [Salicibibacter kimchii]
MPKNKTHLDRKIQNYIDDLFVDVGRSQELFDMKEELSTNLKEKIADYKSRGSEEDEAFKEAVISMGDLSGLVDDMRKHGQEEAKKSVYSTKAARISTAGLIAGTVLVLFGFFNSLMLFFMDVPDVAVVGPFIFIVAGGALLTYSALTRETSKRFAMNKVRASLYALAIGLVLFGLQAALSAGFATGEMFIAISSLMVFFIAGIGLFLGLILTGASRRKKQ